MEYKNTSNILNSDFNLQWAKNKFIPKKEKEGFVPLNDREDVKNLIFHFLNEDEIVNNLVNLFSSINIEPYPDPYDMLNYDEFLSRLENILFFDDNENDENTYIRLTSLKLITYLTSGFQDEESPFIDDERVTRYLNFLTPSNGAFINQITDLFFNLFSDNNIGVQFCEMCYNKCFLERICGLIQLDPNSSLLQLYVKMIKRFIDASIDPVLESLQTHDEEEDTIAINLEPFYFLAKTLHIMFPKDPKTNIRVCKILYNLLELEEIPKIISGTPLFDNFVNYLLKADKDDNCYAIVFNTYNELVETLPPEFALNSIPKLLDTVQSYSQYSSNESVTAVTNFLGQAYEHQFSKQVCNKNIFGNLCDIFESCSLESKRCIINVISLYSTEFSFHDNIVDLYPWVETAIRLVLRELECVSSDDIETILKRLIFCFSNPLNQQYAQSAIEEGIEETLESIMEYQIDSVSEAAEMLMNSIHSIINDS